MEDLQTSVDLDGQPTVGDVLDRIQTESRDPVEQGRWFEELFMRVAVQEPEFQIEENNIWRWAQWPEREVLTGLDGRDIGVDLVARMTNGDLVAIQCKCYDESRVLNKGEIDKFLGGSQQSVFKLRWIVATCPWGPNAQSAIHGANPHVGQIDFRDYLDVQVEEQLSTRPIQQPWPLQIDAIEDTVAGLKNHDRGRLVMACGTGKTFTALRIAEQIVDNGGGILFAAPSIALVSQARREWLRHTTRKLDCLVVCSDPTAGGRNENEDIRVSEFECPVTTDRLEIANALSDRTATCVVFCTYHSLGRVSEAQALHNAPIFDLAIADEAHRTTGAITTEGRAKNLRKIDFQEFHDDLRLRAQKRLYMTATPRIYTAKSKRKLMDRGIEVVDMEDQAIYGPELHRLSFKKAVEARMLSDYRVIVLGVSRSNVTPGLRRRLEEIDTKSPGQKSPTTNDMTRVLGVSLAVNGAIKGKQFDQPDQLTRTLAFSNSIARSKWYAEALTESEVLRATTRQMTDGRAMKVVSRHLDANASALRRNQELRLLANADREGQCRILCNVKLFTEGVDVPTLDAVAFLDPRESQVDVVQAVGRVMRRAEGKRFGYIVVPVVVDPGLDIIDALENSSEGFHTVGRVLRALQAHDGRLAESPLEFIRLFEVNDSAPKDQGSRAGEEFDSNLNLQFGLKEVEQGIYAHVAAASGIGKPGQLVADEIADTVRRVSKVLEDQAMEEPLGDALGLLSEEDGGAKGICTVAALMLCNACLLQRRLRDEPDMKMILRLDKVAGASNPQEILAIAWEAILEKDYAPVFRPALTVLRALRESRAINDVIRTLAECANRVADSLSELGYDHAGPLYHRILSSAKSDGAFYTNNLSAILLARLAFNEKFIDWNDIESVKELRIIDPACGTGTLLMATLRTIMVRIANARDLNEEQRRELHKRLVEDVLCGLDINQHAVQLAACNLTLGAPSVDYTRMNLLTMPHGPQEDGSVRAGSLELLNADAERIDLFDTQTKHTLEDFEADQVSASKEIRFPLRDLDGVIMNPPFTNNMNRSRKFSTVVRKRMQANEIDIRNRLELSDPVAGAVINSNSIRTYFTPLVDHLLQRKLGVLASVIPTTACVGESGIAERRLLASRFHIERIITTHDPKRPAFSENTGIHESLLICRRTRAGGGGKNSRPPTEFVSLRRMPTSIDEAINAADAIASGEVGEWGSVQRWSADRILEGDWNPVQWYDEKLANVAHDLECSVQLEPIGLNYHIGPAGQGIRATYAACEEHSRDAKKLFWVNSSRLRRTLLGEPEDWRCPKDGKTSLALKYWAQRSQLLVASRCGTVSGRLTALWSRVRSVGSAWIPVSETDVSRAKALAAWWNSTPVRILLLNNRSKMLTYPTWSLAQLREIGIPKTNNPAWGSLTDAFEAVCDTELLPMREGVDCVARQVIDEAAAEVLDLDVSEITDWRQRLANEPTVSNRPAPLNTTKSKLLSNSISG